MEASNITFDWTRFWVPFNSRIEMDSGLLRDPEDEWGRYTNRALRKTERLLPVASGLAVLCGEPAMGKTFVMQQVAKELRAKAGPEDTVLYLPFRDIPSENAFHRLVFDGSVWKEWVAGAGRMSLLLDGIDEGLMKIPGFVGYLSQLLAGYPVVRLRLILACRSMDWPPTAGEQLATVWGRDNAGPYRWELCPLRGGDVKLAAEKMGLDGGRFLRAVRRNHLTGLASRPLTLRMLLAEFKAVGKIRRSHRELYQRTCLELCRETDSERRVRLQQPEEPVKLLRVAERIAALVLVCNRSSVILSGVVGEADLTVDSVAGVDETVKDVRFTITPDLVRQTLATPLFWPAADGRMHFFHQTFCESLASSYLARLPLPQVRSLLCSRDRHGEYVQPQLQELACWIAGELPEFFDHLREHDPETLLRADLSQVTLPRKKALLCAVLERAELGKLFDVRDGTRFYGGLNFPGIDSILRPYLSRYRGKDNARSIALDIAVACECVGLFPVLLRQLRDRRAASFHVSIAANLSAFLTRGDLSKVEKMLDGPKALPNPAVRLALVLALVRSDFWPLRKAVPLLPALLSEERHGFVYSLASYAEPSDALALLEAIPTWPDAFDALSRFHPFVEKAFELGVEQLDHANVRGAFARVWLEAHRRYDSFDGRQPLTLKDRLATQQSIRRAFLRDLIAVKRLQRVDYAYIVGLQQPDDFAWWLNELPGMSAIDITNAADAIAHSYQMERDWPELGLLLQRIVEVPALAVKFSWLRAWNLDEPSAIEARNNYREHEEWRLKVEARRPVRKPAEPIWTSSVQQARGGTNDGWYQVVRNFFYEDSHTESDKALPWDLTTSPGWQAQTAEVQNELRVIGREFLIRQPGDPLLATRGRTNHTEYAYRTLYLLRNQIRADQELRESATKHWLPICYQDFWNNDAAQPEMVKLAEDLDPLASERYFRDLLKQRARGESRHLHDLRILQSVWKPSLSVVLARFLGTGRRRSETIESGLAFLEDVDSPTAQSIIVKLVRSGLYPECETIQMWARMVRLDVVEAWPHLEAQLRKAKFARNLFIAIAGQHQHMKWPKGRVGAGRVLAAMYRLLVRIFPPEKENTSAPGHDVEGASHREVEFLRSETFNTLVTLGSEEGCTEMQKLVADAPAKDRLWLNWRLHDSITHCRRMAWTPITVAEVGSLMRVAERRLLRSEDDLLALVMESLVRLELTLQRRTHSPIRDYWRDKGKAGRPESEVECAGRVAQWLNQDLDKRKGITVGREVVIQWNERTDIEVNAVAISGQELRPLTVVTEVKGDWHPDIIGAARSQLGQRYLVRTGRTHGLYLVLWTRCATNVKRRSKLKAKAIEDARVELADIVLRNSIPTLRIDSFVLDISLPDTYVGKSRRSAQKRQAGR